MAGRVSDWLSRVWSWKRCRRATEQPASGGVSAEDDLTRALGRFEAYVVKAQKVLIWENPIISIACVIAVNMLFWLVYNFEFRFYGLIFSTLLLWLVYDVWTNKIWPEISIPAEETPDDWTTLHPSVPEISHYLNVAYNRCKRYCCSLKSLRDEQPGVFCSIMSGGFLTLTLIGRAVPGFVIGYVLIMMIMIGPGLCLRLLPPSAFENIRYFHTVFGAKGKDTDSEVEDYLPEQTGENLAVLHLAGELDVSDKDDMEDSNHLAEEFSLEAEGAGDSTGTQTSFTTGVGVMPAHDDGSTDGLDASDFDVASLPQADSSHIKRQLDPDVSDSDQEELGEIQFQSSHFNGDSSEEEERHFTQGLSFSDSVAKVASKESSSTLGEALTSTVVQAVSKNISSLGVMGQSLLSSVIGGSLMAANPKTAESSESEDDFEMISQEDLS